ncbi:MAG TPA: protein kinase, partial [Vicinamibacteria bacterium]
MRGNLNRTKLPAIIRSFYAERKSGVLHLSCPPGARRIFFRQGRIVRVESDAEPDRAGEQGNALSAEERKGAEIRRMSEIVQPLLASTAGEFRFEESEVPVPKEGAVELPAEQLILDGVRRISDSSVLRALVGDVGATLRTTSSCAFPVFQIKLTPGERGLLESTRKQPSSVGQVLSGSGLGDVETLRALYALLSIGLLEAEGGREAAPPVEDTAPVEAAPEPAPAPASLAPAKEASRAESIPKRFGRYEIQRQLARSSTGILYRGRDPEIDRIVAIKVLHPMVGQPAEVEKLRESFQQEFQKARQLHHPGIVAILEAGMTKEGRPFLITEYVPGTTLRDQLAPGPLAVKHALDLATQIVDALAHAHSRGVVHRRLKPSSVLMTADGRVKIKDFALPGTPEERAGRVADARADVFSFGVLAYRMLTGVLPFPEGSASPSTNPPAPLEKYVRDLPLRFGKIIFRCLAGDPLERFPDAGELKRAWSAPEAPASTATQAVAPVPPPPRPQAPVPAPPKAAEPVHVTRPPAPT